MGSSFIEYRDYGFWSADEFIEILAGEVANQLRAVPNDWNCELVDHWTLMAKGHFGGWIHLKLDEFLTTESRRLELREAIFEVTKQYAPNDPIRDTAEFLIELLDSRLKIDASHTLHYMVQRPKGWSPPTRKR